MTVEPSLECWTTQHRVMLAITSTLSVTLLFVVPIWMLVVMSRLEKFHTIHGHPVSADPLKKKLRKIVSETKKQLEQEKRQLKQQQEQKNVTADQEGEQQLKEQEQDIQQTKTQPTDSTVLIHLTEHDEKKKNGEGKEGVHTRKRSNTDDENWLEKMTKFQSLRVIHRQSAYEIDPQLILTRLHYGRRAKVRLWHESYMWSRRNCMVGEHTKHSAHSPTLLSTLNKRSTKPHIQTKNTCTSTHAH